MNPYLTLESDLIARMRQFRRDIHAHPELAFKEFRTADKVAEVLETLNLDAIHRGQAVTGIVAVLKGRNPDSRHIGLRADMDALPLCELNHFDHASRHEGKMHACGHDGHTSMLLTAACWLSENRDAFEGTVYFIFQPAEEGEGGARVMVEEEDFFGRFPVEATYGMHNWPGLPQGHFGIHHGPVMAAMDTFALEVKGRGGHGGIPNLANDPIVASAQLVSGFQTIVARNVSPLEQAVVSVTQIHGGDGDNIIPDSVTMSGTVRSFSREVREKVITRMKEVCAGIEVMFGVEVVLDYRPGFPPTINHADNAEICIRAAKKVAGEGAVIVDLPPSMGAEDFAYFILEHPGAYIWIGNGEQSPSLHNPHYDFNDDNLVTGANYWIELVISA